MSENFKLFTVKFFSVCPFNRFFGVCFFLKLNKTVSTTCTIIITLKFTFDDWAKAGEKLVNLLLRRLATEILNVEVCFRIGVVLELQTDSKHFSVQFKVIQSLLACFRLLQSAELGVTIIERFLGGLILRHFCFENIKAMTLDELE
jgi:hypothetical protein